MADTATTLVRRDARFEPDVVARAEAQMRRRGIRTFADYMRQAMVAQVHRDESNDPQLRRA